MLGVRLREHHQLDVGRIALRAAKEIDEVIDLVVGQRQPEQAVRLDQGGAATGKQVDAAQRLRREVAKQFARLREVVKDGLQHAVMEQGGDERPLGGTQRVRRARQTVGDAAFDALDPLQAAVVRDVGRLRRPGRDGADAWCDQEELARRRVVGRTFAEQCGELPALVCRCWFVTGDEVPVVGAEHLCARDDPRESLLQALQAEGREGGGTAEKQEFGHGGLGLGGRQAALREAGIIADPALLLRRSIGAESGRGGQQQGQEATEAKGCNARWGAGWIKITAGSPTRRPSTSETGA